MDPHRGPDAGAGAGVHGGEAGAARARDLLRLYLDVGDLADCTPDDPRLPSLADRVVAFLEAAEAEFAGVEEEQAVDDDLVALLDTAFVEHFPCAPRLFELLEERGFIGWTNIRRKDPAPTPAERDGRM